MPTSLIQTGEEQLNWPQKLSGLIAKQLFNQPDLKAYFGPFIKALMPQWQAQGFRSRVLSNLRLNEKAFSLTLRPEPSWKGFEAGQYVDISVEVNGARLIRTFSISSSPQQFRDEGTIELTIGIKDGGKVTPWLSDQLPEGCLIYISEAKGDFVVEDHTTPLVLIGGGTGITPLHAIIQDIASRRSKQPTTLIYFARNFLFLREFEQIQNAHANITIHLVDTQAQGHMHQAQLNMLCPNLSEHQAMICGPHNLIKSARSLLLEADVRSIQYEYFGAEPIEQNLAEGATHIHFARSNITSKSEQADTLLNLAEANGLNPVTGCRRGVCHQCICQKEQGVVFNTITQSYSDNGPQEIQLCVSVPATDVTLNL